MVKFAQQAKTTVLVFFMLVFGFQNGQKTIINNVNGAKDDIIASIRKDKSINKRPPQETHSNFIVTFM
jgi:hypothetical protein